MINNSAEEFTELGHFTLEPELIRRLPLPFCHRHKVVILGKKECNGKSCLIIGMLEPENSKLLHELTSDLECEIEPVRLNQHEITKALNAGYGNELVGDSEAGHIIILDEYNEKSPSSETPVKELIDHMLIDAVVKQASDIHLENYIGDTDLRFRIDGMLQQVFSHITRDNIGAVVNRIKVMAGLDITENRLPQDGRFRCTMTDNDLRSVIDFRVNVLPGPSGQDVVIRILNSDIGRLDINKLGLQSDTMECFLSLIHNPEGLILVTGPTGSGKTTTLYSALNLLRDKGKKILTAEDPIEYYVEKINQKQSSSILDMALLSRSFLRHDPDVMLIGEIRDLDTAETASKAASTGHLVLSTLHTPDAIGAIQRLKGLGLESNEIAHSLLGIMAQRLVRKVCPHCAEVQEPDEKHVKLLGVLLEGVSNKQGAGCDECFGTGYLGRIGIYELLVIDDEIQDLIFSNVPANEIKKAARKKGFSIMLEDAIKKVSMGITSLEEIFRVIPYRQLATAAKEAKLMIDSK